MTRACSFALCVTAAALVVSGCGRTKAVADAAEGGDAGGAGFTPFEPAPVEAAVPERPAPVDLAPDAADGDADADAADGAVDGDASDGAGGGDGSRTDASDGPPAFSCVTGTIQCDPFLCDVATGRCGTSCKGPEDCVAGKICTFGSCGVRVRSPCIANEECKSGFCADGVCCASACPGPCRSCALVASPGICTPVAAGNLDPHGFCAAGQRCDGQGTCATTVCAADAACPRFQRCTAGRCVACAATCVNSTSCVPGAICAEVNGCTFCTVRDAGVASN